MYEFLLSSAVLALATVAAGLVRILRGPSAVDRMLATQLLGTGGIAALLLLGTAMRMAAAVDVALTLALLAAFAAAALARAVAPATDARTVTPATDADRHGRQP
jgi:multicomponent Na+:H+ antiporter subunit F